MSLDEWRAQDRIRGALLGAVIGDALGARHRHHSEALVAEPAPGSLPVGGATQLMLLTAEALIQMQQRAAEKGIGPAWDILRYGPER